MVTSNRATFGTFGPKDFFQSRVAVFLNSFKAFPSKGIMRVPYLIDPRGHCLDLHNRPKLTLPSCHPFKEVEINPRKLNGGDEKAFLATAYLLTAANCRLRAGYWHRKKILLEHDSSVSGLWQSVSDRRITDLSSGRFIEADFRKSTAEDPLLLEQHYQAGLTLGWSSADTETEVSFRMEMNTGAYFEQACLQNLFVRLPLLGAEAMLDINTDALAFEIVAVLSARLLSFDSADLPAEYRCLGIGSFSTTDPQRAFLFRVDPRTKNNRYSPDMPQIKVTINGDSMELEIQKPARLASDPDMLSKLLAKYYAIWDVAYRKIKAARSAR